MTRLHHVSGYTRRAAPRPSISDALHTQLRDEIETARVEAELSDEAVIAELAEMLLDARM